MFLFAAVPCHYLLLITIDTLRADRLGSYGHAGATTPTLDGLAGLGIRFKNAFTPFPRTTPALASRAPSATKATPALASARQRRPRGSVVIGAARQ